MSTLFNAILNTAIQSVSENEDNEPFNQALAEIQKLIGQEHGDNASMFFDEDVVERWGKSSVQDRIEILADYIKYEVVSELDIGDAFKTGDIGEHDLFSNYKLQPSNLAGVTSDYLAKLDEGEEDGYKVCKEFLEEVEKLGFSFYYYLDACPIDLRLKA